MRQKGPDSELFDLPLQAEDGDDDSLPLHGGADDAPPEAPEEEARGPSIWDALPEEAAEDLPLHAADASVDDVANHDLDEILAEALGSPQGDAVVPDAPVALRDRLLAGLLDLGIQFLVLGGTIAAVQAMGIRPSLDQWMPFALLALIFSFLYWFIPLAFWGQTPGMAWTGHCAVSPNGEPLTFVQTMLRWIGALVTVALAGLPLLLALGGRSGPGRSLTDRLSDSKTVQHAEE